MVMVVFPMGGSMMEFNGKNKLEQLFGVQNDAVSRDNASGLSCLVTPRVLEKKVLDKQTDGQDSDPIRVPFFSFEVWNPQKELSWIQVCAGIVRKEHVDECRQKRRPYKESVGGS
ncbi:hypothetical protein EVAR_42858_1 [Eumeta japonica]|uniref:Uncharacterized protein n=1 Tax=Eumeta variegata TaxID=151549 RepID=A0A4C1WJ42_EUMVA|nr:hypothetical protein EVAR_42858_1 [Eumeta japonica]